MFRHPSYYKKLRERNRDRGNTTEQSIPQSDRVISEQQATASSVRAPGLGHKRQAIEESVPHNDIEEAQATSSKRQASSTKLLEQQATSIKPQA